MPKPIGNQTFNLKQSDKVGWRTREKFEGKSAAPGKTAPEAQDRSKPKYKTRKK